MTPQPERRILVKAVVQMVTATAVGDRIVGEHEGQRIACYSKDDLAQVWEQAVAEVGVANGANRASRRRGK